MYKVQLSRQAQKDVIKVERAGLKSKTAQIIQTVRNNPYDESQGFEKLKGDLKGFYSRQINYQHRFVYEVLLNAENLTDAKGMPYDGIVKVLRMWTHYE